MNTKISKKKAYIIVTILIILGAAILRLVDLPNRVQISWDLSLFNIFAYKSAFFHEKLVHGPGISGLDAAFLPPTFYYLTNFLLKITDFNYFTLPVLTAVANLFAITLVAIFLPRYFGKIATIICIFLYGVSSVVIYFSIFGTNLELVPPITVIIIIELLSLSDRRNGIILPMLAFTISLATHLHTTPIFILPGILFVLLIHDVRIKVFSKNNLKYLIAAILTFIIVGFLPHYLENRAFGNQPFLNLKEALFQQRSEVTKYTSLKSFLVHLIDINGELLFPNPWDPGHNSKNFDTGPAFIAQRVTGFLITIIMVIWSVKTVFQKKTSKKIIGIIFLTYLLLQALLPTYLPGRASKPTRWLSAVYFPIYFIIIGVVVHDISISFNRILNKKLGILATIFAIVLVLTLNIYNWFKETSWEGLPKLITYRKIAAEIINSSQNEPTIHTYSQGDGFRLVWALNVVLWRETRDFKYVHQLLWDTPPERNSPIYLVSKPGERLKKDEQYAATFQDSSKLLMLKEIDGTAVEKVFNEKI